MTAWKRQGEVMYAPKAITVFRLAHSEQRHQPSPRAVITFGVSNSIGAGGVKDSLYPG